ncbi:MAG: RNA methyltransferase [Eubacteriales bacterium]|nr:RNA methyltransferase [Bacillota bacterium]MBV1726514.1 RNA methyltransferase [Desulforudis sp.]MDP3050714.1 RNA methyltransferase [Eubacteriales bacterium]MBU4532041.1 RNA methyltransferase [Bacillota bacterium]MBU4554435.1 RNA methyltransferase [Bacillota bacterium]
MFKITSRHNPKVKYLRQFQHRKHRDREGKFLVEGVRVVEEALTAGFAVEVLVFTPEALGEPRTAALATQALDRGVSLWSVEKALMLELAGTETPQGVLALVHKAAIGLDEVLADRGGVPLVLVVDGIQDPGNLGTIIRTADACAVTGVVLLKDTVDLYHPRVVRSTAGSIFHLPIAEQVDPSELVGGLKEHGFQILAGDPKGERSLYDCDLTKSTAVAVGHETRGVGSELKTVVDTMVCIPMPGRAESLNVSVATALLIYEAVRQRAKSSLC